MIFYEKVTITGNAVHYFKKRKNGKPIRNEQEVMSMEIDYSITSEELEKLLEVLPDMFCGDIVEFDIHTKITNG
tara:strand:+ start:76 stop:297 length:222 start_codon:yes stop_codon:yes gene_type:complete